MHRPWRPLHWIRARRARRAVTAIGARARCGHRAGAWHRSRRPHRSGRCIGAYVKGQLTLGTAAPAAKVYAQLPDFSKWGGVERKPMSNIRRKTAEHTGVAGPARHAERQGRPVGVRSIPRDVWSARGAGGKLTITAVVIKILAAAIDRFPQFASSVDMASESIVYKHYRHIGVAVDTPNGLLVPVIRDVTTKTITQIAVELGTLSQKARDKKLSLDEMSGSVMSVTNLGGIGGTSFTPIVNQPEWPSWGCRAAASSRSGTAANSCRAQCCRCHCRRSPRDRRRRRRAVPSLRGRSVGAATHDVAIELTLRSSTNKS